MADSLSNIYASLNGGGYDAQRAVYNQQLSGVDSDANAAVAGLDQQKVNSFKGIDNQAASRGMFYSGAPIAEQQQYVGGTYLPALANVKSQAQQQKYGLQQALAGVTTNQNQAAQGIYQNQVANDQQQNYYNQMLANQRQSAAASLAAQRQSSAAPNPFSMSRDKVGGYAITLNGKPATLAQYAAANGGTVASYLAQGSANDKALAAQMAGMTNPAQISKFMAAHPQIFSGA